MLSVCNCNYKTWRWHTCAEICHLRQQPHTINITYSDLHNRMQQNIIAVSLLVYMKSNISWDIMPCSPMEDLCFGGTCLLHLQVRKMSQARHQHEAVSKPSDSLIWRILRLWIWRHVPQNIRLIFSGLHGVIFQNIELSSTILLSNSNSIYNLLFIFA
jgi:hypothetical protein